MGINDLSDRAVGMPIDDLLEGLSIDLRDKLEAALRKRHPLKKREYLWSAPEIQRHCADDGYEVSLWSIQNWRRKHAH